MLTFFLWGGTSTPSTNANTFSRSYFGKPLNVSTTNVSTFTVEQEHNPIVHVSGEITHEYLELALLPKLDCVPT